MGLGVPPRCAGRDLAGALTCYSNMVCSMPASATTLSRLKQKTVQLLGPPLGIAESVVKRQHHSGLHSPQR